MRGKSRKEYRQHLIALRDKYKAKSCHDCYHIYPLHIMELDHREPHLKNDNIGALIRKAINEYTFIKELNKCDVVCANCHREREFQRDNYNKTY